MSMGQSVKFGTDGVRGVANATLSADSAATIGRAVQAARPLAADGVLSAESALLLGRASANALGDAEWVIGWDTRMSSEMLAAAFAAGVASAGRQITALGVVPTANVALSCLRRQTMGAMITASHNPFIDNGIKIFGSDGIKLDARIETGIEEMISDGGGLVRESAVGGIRWNTPVSLRDEYKTWLVERASTMDASGLRIGLDCANGAAYKVAPVAIKATGADVRVIAARPDGVNINRDCGSTDIERLRALVRREGLDLGLALDGDADRLLAVDADGARVDGDNVIAILARHRSGQGRLAGDGVVVTEWSNLGLRLSLERAGIKVRVCDVGDKAVADAMRDAGYVLGGEQSGHVIQSELLPVGDGVSTAMELIRAVVDAGLPVSQVSARAMITLPQQSRNIAVAMPSVVVVRELAEARRQINEELGEGGRLVLRSSGTQPSILRVMVEAEDDERVAEVMKRVVELVSPYSDEPEVHVAG